MNTTVSLHVDLVWTELDDFDEHFSLALTPVLDEAALASLYTEDELERLVRQRWYIADELNPTNGVQELLGTAGTITNWDISRFITGGTSITWVGRYKVDTSEEGAAAYGPTQWVLTAIRFRRDRLKLVLQEYRLDSSGLRFDEYHGFQESEGDGEDSVLWFSKLQDKNLLFAAQLWQWLIRRWGTGIEGEPEGVVERDVADAPINSNRSAGRKRDAWNDDAINRLLRGEPEDKVRADWRSAYQKGTNTYPADMTDGEDKTWQQRVWEPFGRQKRAK